MYVAAKFDQNALKSCNLDVVMTWLLNLHKLSYILKIYATWKWCESLQWYGNILKPILMFIYIYHDFYDLRNKIKRILLSLGDY